MLRVGRDLVLAGFVHFLRGKGERKGRGVLPAAALPLRLRARPQTDPTKETLTNFLFCTKMVSSSVSALYLMTSPSRLRYSSSVPAARQKSGALPLRVYR